MRGGRARIGVAFARRARGTGRTAAPLLLAILLLGGCATADLDVVRPVPVVAREVVLELRDDTPGDMSADDVSEFEEVVANELEAADIAVVPPGTRGATRVEGYVVRWDPGIRALRYVSGYGLGTATVITTWEVLDDLGRGVARCRIEGSLSMGTFGGSVHEIQEEIGRGLVRFLLGGVH